MNARVHTAGKQCREFACKSTSLLQPAFQERPEFADKIKDVFSLGFDKRSPGETCHQTKTLRLLSKESLKRETRMLWAPNKYHGEGVIGPEGVGGCLSADRRTHADYPDCNTNDYPEQQLFAQTCVCSCLTAVSAAAASGCGSGLMLIFISLLLSLRSSFVISVFTSNLSPDPSATTHSTCQKVPLSRNFWAKFHHQK